MSCNTDAAAADGGSMHAGVVMIFLRFKTVATSTDDASFKCLNIFSLIFGCLATLFLSFVANFPEEQPHGVGLVHIIGAYVVFGCGCLFMVIDAVTTVRMRRVITDADLLEYPHQHWRRSLRWLAWVRPIIAVLSICACVLCATGLALSVKALDARGGNATRIIPHHWRPDENGYAMHVQGATCEWLMGILFIIYSLMFIPEFQRFTIHVKLEPTDHNEPVQPDEHSPLFSHTVNSHQGYITI